MLKPHCAFCGAELSDAWLYHACPKRSDYRIRLRGSETEIRQGGNGKPPTPEVAIIWRKTKAQEAAA